MESIRTLTVSDISRKLAIHPFTVKRWITSGKLKGEIVNNRQGYKVKVTDFEEFLNANPKYGSINDQNIPYEKAKVDILKDLMIGMYELQKEFLMEEHGKVYSEGWNTAMERFDGLVKQCLVDSY